MSKSNIHPVSSTGIQTHGLLDVSLLPLPLDQGCSPKPDQLFKFASIRFQTTRKGLSAIADLDNSRRTFLSSPRSNRLEQNSPTIRVRSFGSYEPSSPRSIPSVLLPSPGPEDRGYKEFKKPNNIQGPMLQNLLFDELMAPYLICSESNICKLIWGV